MVAATLTLREISALLVVLDSEDAEEYDKSDAAGPTMAKAEA